MSSLKKAFDPIPSLRIYHSRGKFFSVICNFTFITTILQPFLKPILKSATSGLQSVSGEVIDNHDQYEVFNDPRAVSSFARKSGIDEIRCHSVRPHALFLEQRSLRKFFLFYFIAPE